ncbi:MAG: HD domain-containing protein [Candidatus Bathyarchaeia archaeon]
MSKAFGRRYWSFIKDPIYGYIHITEQERDLIDTRPIQRLRRIKQLCGVEYVYPAANHTRFEHSLGVMYLAGVLAENLEELASEMEKLRIAALLHDVGHGPFSHLFENLLMRRKGLNHEDMTFRIITETDLADLLRRQGYDPKEIGAIAVGRLKDLENPILGQIVHGTIDVDKLDFIVRDSYHTGAGYGFVDIFRLIYTMDFMDGKLAVDATALSTLESFLLARLESFRTIYYHRAARAAQIMILDALQKAETALGILEFDDLDGYLALDDYSLWGMLVRCEASKPIMKALEERKLLKAAYDRTFFAEDTVLVSLLLNERVRQRVEAEIAERVGIPPEEVFIDVPSLPSVPYHTVLGLEPMEIPIFKKTKDGNIVPQRLAELSKIGEVLRSFMNIVRVYTKEPYREKVGKASEEILGKPSLSQIVSY